MKPLFKFQVSLFAIVLAVAGCSQPTQKTYSDDDEDTPTGGILGSAGGTSVGDLVTVPVTLIDRTEANGFSLASATAYSISMDSCASGQTGTATDASTGGLDVYLYDRGCLAKLTTFTFAANVLIPTVADPFTTWAQGDTAVFDVSGGDGTLAMSVSVVSTLADPVTGAEVVSYQFSEMSKGADKSILEATVGTTHTLTVGSQDPPNYTISLVSFLSTTVNGAGQFTFKLNCGVDLGATTTCDSLAFADTKYMLVEDTYTLNTMTIGDAVALDWTNDGVTVVNALDNTDVDSTNGGFLTATVDGPDAMGTNPNMMLIIEADGVSYTYFNIDVSTLSQD
jgi:hypothetical protein